MLPKQCFLSVQEVGRNEQLVLVIIVKYELLELQEEECRKSPPGHVVPKHTPGGLYLTKCAPGGLWPIKCAPGGPIQELGDFMRRFGHAELSKISLKDS